MNSYRICVYFLCFCVKVCIAQAPFSNVKYKLESGVYLSTSGRIPFWLHSNQYGIVPLESQFLTLRGTATKEYDSTKNGKNKQTKFSYGYGLSTVINIGKANKIILPEGYMKVRYGVFELYSGRRKEIVGLVDTILTSGSYIWSGNALSIPKIQISIPNYTSIIGHGLISIKGAFAHGWFDNGFVKNFYLHQKWMYGRIGKPNWKLKFYGGFNHQVQWGGEYATPQKDPNGLTIDKLPSDFKSFLYLISGVSINKGDDGISAGRPLNEQWNRIGNHLGTVDVALDWSLREYNLFIYRQSIYEDGSLFYLNNISDGLLGIGFKNNNFIKRRRKFNINKVLFEYLNTTSQGGITDSGNTISQLRGLDNYFNNSVYIDGWSYKDNSIGTPFFLDKNFLNLKDGNIVKFRNTRLQSYILSLAGIYKDITFLSRYSKSVNYGTYFSPINFTQHNMFLNFNYYIYKQKLGFNFEFEKNSLFKNNTAFFLSWTKYY